MDEYLPHHGHFLLRGKGDGRVMMIGVLKDSEIELDNKGEIWLIQFIITDKKRYKEPAYLRGYRADQVLCEAIRLKDLEEIKPKSLSD